MTGRASMDDPSFGALIEALANRHRRRLLRSLLEREPRDGGPLTLEEFTAGYGNGDGDALEIEMVHAHLPKLVAMDVVAWRRGTGEVRTGPRFDEVRLVLELVRG